MRRRLRLRGRVDLVRAWVVRAAVVRPAQLPSLRRRTSRSSGVAGVTPRSTARSVQADNGCGLTQGIIGLVNKGQPRKLDDWGVLSAWGWGMSRLLDYLETDKAVDAKRVATMGHSRGGKAALVALAYDQRFSTGFISSSGQSGAKLHRRNYGEVIENIAAANEYHWMAGNYLKYGGRWDMLPVDSHELIAMVAPRPVFLGAGNDPLKNPDGSIKLMDPNDPACLPARGPCATQAAEIYDAWVDAKGTFLAGVGAGPVYTAARQEGPRHDRVSGPRDRADDGRHRLPPALGRAHAGSELGLLPRFRRQVLGPETGRAVRTG